MEAEDEEEDKYLYIGLNTDDRVRSVRLEYVHVALRQSPNKTICHVDLTRWRGRGAEYMPVYSTNSLNGR